MRVSTIDWALFQRSCVSAMLFGSIITSQANAQTFFTDLVEDAVPVSDTIQEQGYSGATDPQDFTDAAENVNNLGEAVLYKDRIEFFKQISGTMFAVTDSHFWGFDENGNIIEVFRCNEENEYCRFGEEKLLEYNAFILPGEMKSNDGKLEICYGRKDAVLIFLRVQVQVDDFCLDELTWGFETYYEETQETKELASFFDTIQKPPPFVRNKTLYFTNWQHEVRSTGFRQNPDLYALKRIFLGQEYAWSEWANFDGEALYSVNKLEYTFYRPNSEIFGYREICLSDSLNTVFDFRGCFDVVNIDENAGPTGIFENARYMFVSDEEVFGVREIYAGDRYDIRSRFDNQVWTPVFANFITGFTSGLMM